MSICPGKSCVNTAVYLSSFPVWACLSYADCFHFPVQLQIFQRIRGGGWCRDECLQRRFQWWLVRRVGDLRVSLKFYFSFQHKSSCKNSQAFSQTLRILGLILLCAMGIVLTLSKSKIFRFHLQIMQRHPLFSRNCCFIIWNKVQHCTMKQYMYCHV